MGEYRRSEVKYKRLKGWRYTRDGLPKLSKHWKNFISDRVYSGVDSGDGIDSRGPIQSRKSWKGK